MSYIRDLGSGLLGSLRIMSRNKVGFAGLIITMTILLVSLLAPQFIDLKMTADIEKIYQGPSAEHWLGTDYQGRDIFKQLLLGGTEVIYVAFLAGLLGTVIGVGLGSLAAVLGGWVDTIATAAAELVITIPQYPLLLVLAGFIRLNSPAGLAVIIAAVGWGGLMLTIRSQVLSLKERDYVQAARALGLPVWHLLLKEIIPNMMSYILTSLVMRMTNAIYGMVGLIFLGVVPIAQNNWGVMYSLANRQGAIFGVNSAWYILAPIFTIALFQFGLINMNRSLEELFNPRLRRGE
ncbi:MAG: DppC2 [Symbiobacteriaceae bacterium]|jgi:peptide/nickel transport system permease protein|nr:DppC2 [Symbiobacteriaceae bacterium]